MKEPIDQIIFFRVYMILAEMGLNRPISVVDDFDPEFCIKQYYANRLYEFHLEIRDDEDLGGFVEDLCAELDQYNKISTVKADFVAIEDYPGSVKNWTTVYLTVATI